MLGGRFGCEKEFGDGAEGGEEVSDCGGAHEGWDAGEVYYSRFATTGGSGCVAFGF